jgi:hypothetical protein
VLGAAPGITSSTFSARGGRSGEGTVQLDGMNVGSSVGGGGTSSYNYDMNNAAEVQVTIAGGLADVDSRRARVQYDSEDGWNTFSGTYFANYAGEWSQGSNIDDHLKDTRVHRWRCLDQELGHELRARRPDRPRQAVVLRQPAHRRTYVDSPRNYANANAGKENVWTYVPTRASRSAMRIEQDRRRSNDVAGDPAQQARVLCRLHQEMYGIVVHEGQRPVS